MADDSLHFIIHIDSCVFNPPQEDEKDAMKKLWELDEKGIIQLDIGEATEEEMLKAPAKLKDRVNSRIYALDKIGTQGEMNRLIELRRLLFPNKAVLDEGDERDVRNLFCAHKYGCDMFVTVDKKDILSKAKLIKENFGVESISPKQCLKIVRERIEWDKSHQEKMKHL